MEEIKIHLYKCSELKEKNENVYNKAKQKLEELTEKFILSDLINTELEEYWILTELPKLGYYNIEVNYSLSYSQGDGARFTAKIDLSKWVEAHKHIDNNIEHFFNNLYEYNVHFTIQKGHLYNMYTHENTVNVDVDFEDGASSEDQFNAWKLLKIIDRLSKDTMKEIHKHLQNYRESILSDIDYLEECFPEVWFLEDGTKFIYIDKTQFMCNE